MAGSADDAVSTAEVSEVDDPTSLVDGTPSGVVLGEEASLVEGTAALVDSSHLVQIVEVEVMITVEIEEVTSVLVTPPDVYVLVTGQVVIEV